jgi:hypothetical protein
MILLRNERTNPTPPKGNHDKSKYSNNFNKARGGGGGQTMRQSLLKRCVRSEQQSSKLKTVWWTVI